MIHMVPEQGKSKWSHIDDLDSFFSKVYDYHQKHGFTVMMLQETLELIQFIFVVFFTVFMAECINYPLLFKDNLPDGYHGGKITISEIIVTVSFSQMRFFTQMFVLISILFWLTRLIVVIYHVFQFWDIKCFYNSALKIPDSSLDSVTWWEVQKRLVAAQAEHMMCIHKQELTPLDVYHRILRFNNYMVAMVNKSLLPLKFNLPFLGDYVFLSTGLRFNLELILFKSPWAPFNQWHLREDYKRVARRKELADSLKTHILILGCVNLVLMPVILLWQILYSFFNYAEVIKREPGALGVRRWGHYGRDYLRHFNELEHELNARLSRSYKPASQYMDIFVSPLICVLARNVAFMAGSVLAALLLLTVWDEDVVQVEHVITIMTALGAAVAAARVFIPDENLVFCPEKTLSQVLAHIHYFPEAWKGKAHTNKVMNELGLLFPYTAVYLLEELISPIITPIILIFHLRYKSQEIVDFFRNFTVDVVGVGDVCSFAQMDVRRHGNPSWQVGNNKEEAAEGDVSVQPKTNTYTQAEDGKTEMSLIHFTLTNPGWRPPAESEGYLAGLRANAGRDVEVLPALTEEQWDENAMLSSLRGMSNMGGSYSGLAASVMASVPSPPPTEPPSSPPPDLPILRGGMSRVTGPGRPDLSRGLLESRSMLSSRLQPPQSMSGSGLPGPPPGIQLTHQGLELSMAEMSLSALYLHNLRHNRTGRNRASLGQISGDDFPRSSVPSTMGGNAEAGERAPLLSDSAMS